MLNVALTVAACEQNAFFRVEAAASLQILAQSSENRPLVGSISPAARRLSTRLASR